MPEVYDRNTLLRIRNRDNVIVYIGKHIEIWLYIIES